jgi:hypothetical protein
MMNMINFNNRAVSNSYREVQGESVAPPSAGVTHTHTRSDVHRGKRSLEFSDSPEARATADAQVAGAFANALATRSYQTAIKPPDVQVPLESTLGRWRAHLDSAFKSSGFLAWAKTQGLDTTSLKLDPARKELTGIVDGKTHTFSMKDDSGWSDVSRTLLSIAKVIAPNPGHAFLYPWPEGKVPLSTVGHFYDEPIDLTPKQATLHRKALSEGGEFEFKPLANASLRSVEALKQQTEALGDDANRHALIAALRSQDDDASGNINLDKVKIPIDPRSGLFISEQHREMSVAQFLKHEGNKVPINSEQALELARALSFDLAHRAPGVDSGGVRPLTVLLGATSLRKMRTVVDGWKKQQMAQVSNTPAGAGPSSLLALLIGSLPEASRKLIADNPALAMDQLIRSPEAHALGKDIQSKIKIVETPTSAIESVSAALVQELDPLAGTSRYSLAGYNLYGEDNAGASAADIVERFTTHLKSRVGAELAPLAARLLLSAAAPELLVIDTPSNLVLGSHTWANFAIEVSRIEQQVPGASANMTFSQVMAFGDTLPVSLQGDDELGVAARHAVIDWGVANGVVKSRTDQDYSSAEILHAQSLLNKQQKELSWAKNVLSSSPTTRRELALAELKRVFPDVDPTLAVLQAPWVKHDPVSLLDIYMTGKIQPDNWESIDEKAFPYEGMKSRFSQLVPDINVVFSNKFEEVKKDHESAWAITFKYQFSLLPKADREHISRSTVTFLEVSRPYLKTELNPRGSNLFPGRIPRTPTAQELEELKGRHGLLVKAEGSGGEVSYYSYLPGSGKIVKEKGFPGDQTNDDDAAYFGGDTEGRVSGTHNIYKQFGAVNSDRDPPESDDGRRGVYFSARSGALASTTASFFTRDIYALKNQAAGITEIEKGKAYDEKLKGFFLSLVPFYDGIQDAINGNVAGAIFNIGFDILGFFLPGIGAARKASKAGKGALNIIKSGALAGIGASVGFTDSVDIVKNLNKGGARGYKDINKLAGKGDEMLSRLKGNYRRYEPSVNYKEGDIVRGFARYDDGGLWDPVVAILKKGSWYAYNTLTKTPYGPQILQFGVLSALAEPSPIPEVSKKVMPVNN